MISLLLWLIFLVPLLLGVPIAFCLGVAGSSFLVLGGNSISVAAQKMYSAVDSFPLLAIPLFVLAAQIMDRAGILQRLVDFFIAALGRLRSGLAIVNVASSMLFAGISGTSVSDVAGMGIAEIKMMEMGGYPKDFGAAVTAASALVGPIIPPSVPMVLYAISAGGNISIGGLFAASLVPGILIGLGQMVYCWLAAKKMPSIKMAEKNTPFLQLVVLGYKALPVLFMPVLIIGGILGGFFTITEAAAVGVVYALFVGFVVTRELRIRDLPYLLVQSASTMGTVALLLAAGSLVSWILTVNQVPAILSGALQAVTNNPYVFMLLVMGFLLVLGCILDVTSALIMLVPILAPLAANYGISQYHFAVVFVVTLLIGQLTPPVGVLLFVTSTVSKVSMESLARRIWPFVAAAVVVVLLCIFFAPLSTFVPRIAGF